MKATTKTDTVWFTVKGQVVIPRRIRKEFEIEEGTRALVYPEGDHIVLRPITQKRYDSLMGCLKDTNAMKVFLDERKREREM
jgi:AbrB family looped-hinge helix DNA binding protein